MAKRKTAANQRAVGIAADQDEEHAKLLRWVNDADDATLGTRESSEKCRNYYDSRQWTDAEIATLKKRKQAATVINRIKPKMDTLMGMEKAAKTTAKAFPRTPKHEKGAEAATESIRFVLQDNAFDQIRSAAWENALIEGTCGAEVIVKPNKEEGYKITINHLMWDRLIYDPHARRKDFSDARFLGQVVWMDYDEAVALYPDAKDILETMQNGSQTYEDQPRWMDNIRRRVKIVELYYKHATGEMYYACFTYGGYCEPPKKSPYVNEEGETEWPYEFASLFVTREGGRYGAVLQLLDPQDDLNKRRSKFQHLLSVRQVRLERGAVEDLNKVRQELAKADGVIETTPGMEFEILKTGDMATAQFQLYQDSKMEMDIVGANSAIQGKSAGDQSGVALRTRQQAGQTEIGPMFDVLRYWQLRVYRKIWNRVRQYWKSEMWVRVTDDETNLRWVGLNKPITAGEQLLQKAQEQGIQPEQLQILQQRIAQDPSMRQVVDTHNDVAHLDMDIIISEVPDVLTAQIEDFQVLGEMVKSGFPMPPLAVIEASPLSNKDKIIKMMKEAPQLSPEQQKQIEALQQQAQDAQKKLQAVTEENQQLKMGAQEKALKIQADQQHNTEKYAAETQQMNLNHQLKQDEQARAIALEREKAHAAMQLEREKAAHKLELEQMVEREAGDREMRKAALDGAIKLETARITASKDAAEGQPPAAGTDTTQIMKQILDTQTQLLEKFSAPKQHKIDLIRQNGQTVGANVVVQ